jgi:hypothetical protein
VKGWRATEKAKADLVLAAANIQVAIVKVNRASRALRANVRVQVPEYYESNKVLVALEDLQKKIVSRAGF